MSLTLVTDRRLLRAEGVTVRHLLADGAAPPAAATADRPSRPPVAIAFVLDRSGSMGGDKFDLARQAALAAIDRLSSSDRFAVVVYDDQIDLVCELSEATAQAKQRARQQLLEVEPRGSTALADGWTRGVDELRRAPVTLLRRVLLLTDGLANVGERDPAVLAGWAERFRGDGIATATVGVGEDFDEHLLRGIARNGGGSYWFVETAQQITAVVEAEVGDALAVVMPGAELALALPETVKVTTVDGLRARRDGDVWVLPLGDLVDEQEIRLLVRLEFAGGTPETTLVAHGWVRDREGRRLEAAAPVSWTFTTQSMDGQVRDLVVDRATADAYANRARLRATLLNRERDLDGARTELRATAARILAYAEGDGQMLDLATALRNEAEEYGAQAMDRMELKRRMYDTSLREELRSPSGARSRRRSEP